MLLTRRRTLILLAAPLTLRAADNANTPTTPKKDTAGDWSLTVDEKLPNVLILGDSISIGYSRAVRKALAGKANVFRPMNARGTAPDNCGDSVMGLAGIKKWLGDRKWSVIHFNWGLWDLTYRDPAKPKSGNRDKVNGKLSVTLEDYAANLEKLVTAMEKTGAKLIWASTTLVPEGESGRKVDDDLKYNAAAAAVMSRHNIPTDDLHALTVQFAGKHFTGAGNVHFTDEGSLLLGAQVAEHIRKALP